MSRVLRSRAWIPVFGLCLATIYAAAAAIAPRLAQMERSELVAGALTLDLTLLVPLLYYFLLVRPRGWPVLTVLPVFLAGVLIAGRLIPETEHRVLDLVSYGAVLAELALVVVVSRKALLLRRRYRERAASGADVYDSLRESACSVLGSIAGGALAYEAALFYYAAIGWVRAPVQDPRSFTLHRNAGYAPLAIAVMIALVVETAAVHLLVRLWSPTVAWVLTGLSIYALVWLIGDLHAVRLRAVRVVGRTLELRVGLRWTISIHLGSVRAVFDPKDEIRPKRRAYLKAVLVGAPNRRIELTAPVHATGPYGFSRKVKTIDLQIDDPAGFDALFEGARAS